MSSGAQPPRQILHLDTRDQTLGFLSLDVKLDLRRPELDLHSFTCRIAPAKLDPPLVRQEKAWLNTLGKCHRLQKR